MKLESLAIRGFRGFNELRTIEFHDAITVVSAPNSYGKTSITEALEWLLYGVTSKVEAAQSVSATEYKGSYRNTHLPSTENPYVIAALADGGKRLEVRAELSGEDQVTRSVNGVEVSAWPFAARLSAAPKPFVLQHALKDLLLAKPGDRFERFAGLLGLGELEQIQRDVTSLCTKPEACYPQEITDLHLRLGIVEQGLQAKPAFSAIRKALHKGTTGVPLAYKHVHIECAKRVPVGTDEASILPQLLKLREDAVREVFQHDLSLPSYTPDEAAHLAREEQAILESANGSLADELADIAQLVTQATALRRLEFLDAGWEVLVESPGTCPFCGQAISDETRSLIELTRSAASTEAKRSQGLRGRRDALRASLSRLRQRLQAHYVVSTERVHLFLKVQSSAAQLKEILSPKYAVQYEAVSNALQDLEQEMPALEQSFSSAGCQIAALDRSLDTPEPDAGLATTLAESLAHYIADARKMFGIVTANAPHVAEAGQVLRRELDALAGMEDVSLLIELLDRRQDVECKLAVGEFVASLKELRKTVDQFVSNRMLRAVADELSGSVFHYSGPRKLDTKSGDLKQ